MIYKNLPKKFNPKFEVVSCWMEHDGKILLLKRHANKLEGNRWGVPAGKKRNNESRSRAMLREIREETGQKMSIKEISYWTKVYIKYPEYHYIYHMFYAILGKKPKVALSKNEHKAFKWTSPDAALRLNLVRELDRCIKLSYGKIVEKK